MQNISKEGNTPVYKKVSEFSIILPTFLDGSNTKYTHDEVLQHWGFSRFVEPKDGEKEHYKGLREVLAMPKGWRSEIMGFSGYCIIFDKKKRQRARFEYSNLKSPLVVIPAISSVVDYDTHVLGDFAKRGRGLVGVVKFGGKIIYQSQLMPYRIELNKWGNETEDSIKERERITTHLQRLCANYIQLHYPEKDAMAYWD